MAARLPTLGASSHALKLRGGGEEDGDEGMQAVEEVAWVRLMIKNTCFGRSDWYDVVVDSEMLVRDLKAQLYQNHSSQVCEPVRRYRIPATTPSP